MPAKRNKKYTQTQMLRDLASFREEVAAPRGFRDRILVQLAQETGQAAPSRRRFEWRRVWEVLGRPTALPAAAMMALVGFGAWIALRTPSPELRPPFVETQIPVVRPHIFEKVSSKKKTQIAKAEPSGGTVTLIHGEEVQTTQEGAAQGSLPAQAPAHQAKFTGLAANALSQASSQTSNPAQAVLEAKPTAITVVPGGNPLQGNSQVRGNKIITSRGQYADILFNLQASENVRIECYDRLGRLVAVLADRPFPMGVSDLRWYGANGQGETCPTGIYLIRIVTPEYDDRHKVVVLN